MLLKSVLKISIVFFSVMCLKHISKKHVFGFRALLKFLQASMVDSEVLKLGAVLQWGEEEVSDEAMEAVDLARPGF